METYLNQALAVWNSPDFQALVTPFRTLSSISAMFWMLARLADLAMAGLKRLLFEEAWALLHTFYAIILAAAYAALMFYTSLHGQWHPSLLWREVCGFGFMYVMLGVTFTDLRTRKLKPHTPLAFLCGVAAFLFLARAPGLVRHQGLAEFSRVLELFAAGGWGYVMTGITVLVAAVSLLVMIVSETAFALSPLLYRMKILKALPVRFDFSAGGKGAVAPGLARSWFVLTLIAGIAGSGFYLWPRIRAAGAAAMPMLESRAQSPEAAEAAARLKRVLPAVSFAAVSAMPRGGAVADLSLPVFRKLLSAPREADRWLAAAALDRLDPSFRISREALFSSATAAALPCTLGGKSFDVLMQTLPGDDPARTRTFWIEDGRGVHFTGIGPGEAYWLPGSSSCAVAAFPSAGDTALLAFVEPPKGPGDVYRLWLSAYDPAKREVISAVNAAAGAAADFSLQASGPGVVMADSPGTPAARSCEGACGEVKGVKINSISVRPLAEYRGAMLKDGGIKVLPLPDITYEKSGLKGQYRTAAAFESVFSFDPAAGFLNRWYRLAELADGRNCASVSLDPALPGLDEKVSWACGR